MAGPLDHSELDTLLDWSMSQSEDRRPCPKCGPRIVVEYCQDGGNSRLSVCIFPSSFMVNAMYLSLDETSLRILLRIRMLDHQITKLHHGILST